MITQMASPMIAPMVARLTGGSQSLDALVRAMFRASVQGWEFDLSDFTTLFQDEAGTTQVTAVGQSVSKILDKSGFENHITVATNPPTLRQDDLGYYYLEWDGTNNPLSCAIDLSGVDKLLTVVSFKTATATDYTVTALGAVLSDAGSFDLGTFGGGAILYRTGAVPFGARAGVSMGASTFTLAATIDFAGDSHETENPALRVNGTQYSLTNYGTADTGSHNLGNLTLKLGGGYGTFAGRVYSSIGFARNTNVSAGELETAELYSNSKCGLIAPSFYSDSAEFNPATTYHYGSTFSHVDVRTTATEFVVGITSPVFDYYPQYASIGVWVDGVFDQEIAATGSTMKEYAVTLPAGAKTVSFVNGLQSSENGTFVPSTPANAPMTQVGAPASDCLLFYVDSIGAGSDADPVTQRAFPILARDAIRQYMDGVPPVAVEGWGGRSLHEDCVDGTARAAFVAKVAAYNPTKFCMCIGTNDYGLNLWTAANFETAYAALLDDLHTALPDLQVYCVSPILRSVETANGLGSTLGDYRTSISTAVSTRTTFCEFIDGTALVAIEAIPDGVHPNNDGHFFYAAGLLTAIFT